MLAILFATPADAAIIAGLVRAAFAEYEGVLVPPSGAHHETAAKIAAKLEQGGGFLALQDGAPVGCVVCEVQPDALYFGRLAVLPAARGQGIAGALVDAVENRARAEGYGYTRLGVRVALPQLHAWYARRGYVVTELSAHAGFTEPTMLRMAKRLGP